MVPVANVAGGDRGVGGAGGARHIVERWVRMDRLPEEKVRVGEMRGLENFLRATRDKESSHPPFPPFKGRVRISSPRIDLTLLRPVGHAYTTHG